MANDKAVLAVAASCAKHEDQLRALAAACNERHEASPAAGRATLIEEGKMPQDHDAMRPFIEALISFLQQYLAGLAAPTGELPLVQSPAVVTRLPDRGSKICGGTKPSTETCRRVLPLSEFSPRNKGETGRLRATCKECVAYKQARRKEAKLAGNTPKSGTKNADRDLKIWRDSGCVGTHPMVLWKEFCRLRRGLGAA